jgi:glycerophosphoryl diester phosphodiesterase
VKSKPLLLGHRGCRNISVTHPDSDVLVENSLAAFEYALSQGCDGFEFDVRQTRDGRNVIWHNPCWNRVPIAAADYAQLSGSHGELLPTFNEVLQRFSHRAFLDIELKVSGAEVAVVDALRETPPQHGFMVSSFHPGVLMRLYNIDPGLPLGYICERSYALAIWRNVPIQTVLPRYDLVRKDLIDEAHRLGRKVATWTVNAEDRIMELAEWGIDGLISDDPALLYRTFHHE